ncbi:hypothetical protein MHYP_G00018710 [Metynnis hypsauchen]
MLRWSSWEMAALALLEDLANGRIRRERVFRDHYDFLAHDDDWLISRFRFPRAVLLELCAELGPVLEREAARSRASPVPLQVLTALGFLATGSFQRELADRSGISQTSLSRAMPAVLDGIICMSVVERAIGQLKSRWRCLDRTGGMLLYRPEKVYRIVRACGVLHNVAHRYAVPLLEVVEQPADPEPGQMNAQPNPGAIPSLWQQAETACPLRFQSPKGK